MSQPTTSAAPVAAKPKATARVKARLASLKPSKNTLLIATTGAVTFTASALATHCEIAAFSKGVSKGLGAIADQIEATGEATLPTDKD